MARSTITPFHPRNPDKYSGVVPIPCRSSWEVHFAQYCDTHDGVTAWAHEPVQIPYRDPITGAQKIYIPDFLINYIDSNGSEHVDLVEVKPAHEAIQEQARGQSDRMLVARNMAKWEAANYWCQRHGVTFRVMTEGNLFKDEKSNKAISGGMPRAMKDARAKKARPAPRPKAARKPRKR
jgi:hypothetical protein